MTGPSATPAPSWPVASQSPGTRCDGPMAGRWSGSHGRSPAHAEATGSAAMRGNSRAARRDHRVADRRVDRRVEAAPLARRADEHVALPGRLHDRAELEPAARRLHRAQVGPVDDLVADQAGLRRRELDELALARLERQREPGVLGERAAPRPRRDDHRVRLHPLAVAQHDAGRRHGGHLAPLAHDGARRRGLAGQRPRDRARVALQVAGEEARAADLAGQLGLQRAHLRPRRAAAPPGCRRARRAPPRPPRWPPPDGR